MFGSARHTKPQMRPRRKRKPSFLDPSTRIVAVLDIRYTIGPEGYRLMRCGCEPPCLNSSNNAERLRELRLGKGRAT